MVWIAFGAGLILGVFLGVFILGLCLCAGRGDHAVR